MALLSLQTSGSGAGKPKASPTAPSDRTAPGTPTTPNPYTPTTAVAPQPPASVSGPLSAAASDGESVRSSRLSLRPRGVSISSNESTYSRSPYAQQGLAQDFQAITDEALRAVPLDSRKLNSLQRAAYHGDAKKIRSLLKDKKRDINKLDTHHRCTALHVACYQGALGCVQALLQVSAEQDRVTSQKTLDLDIVDTYGRTALMIATMHNHAAIAELLLQAGASTHIQDHLECNVLHYQLFHADPHLEALLFTHEEDMAVIDKGDMSLLQHAIRLGNHRVAHRLAQAERHVDFADGHGQTALHWAAMLNVQDLMIALLDRGARVDLRDEQGRLAVDCLPASALPRALLARMTPGPLRDGARDGADGDADRPDATPVGTPGARSHLIAYRGRHDDGDDVRHPDDALVGRSMPLQASGALLHRSRSGHAMDPPALQGETPPAPRRAATAASLSDEASGAAGGLPPLPASLPLPVAGAGVLRVAPEAVRPGSQQSLQPSMTTAALSKKARDVVGQNADLYTHENAVSSSALSADGDADDADDADDDGTEPISLVSTSDTSPSGSGADARHHRRRETGADAPTETELGTEADRHETDGAQDWESKLEDVDTSSSEPTAPGLSSPLSSSAPPQPPSQSHRLAAATPLGSTATALHAPSASRPVSMAAAALHASSLTISGDDVERIRSALQGEGVATGAPTLLLWIRNYAQTASQTQAQLAEMTGERDDARQSLAMLQREMMSRPAVDPMAFKTTLEALKQSEARGTALQSRVEALEQSLQQTQKAEADMRLALQEYEQEKQAMLGEMDALVEERDAKTQSLQQMEEQHQRDLDAQDVDLQRMSTLLQAELKSNEAMAKQITQLSHQITAAAETARLPAASAVAAETLAELEGEIATLTAQIDSERTIRTRTEVELATATAHFATLEAKLSELRAVFDSEKRAAQDLLAACEATAAARAAALKETESRLADAVAGERQANERVATLTQRIETLEATSQTLTAQVAQQTSQAAAATAAATAASDRVTQAEAALQTATQTQASTQAERDTLQANLAALQQEHATLLQARDALRAAQDASTVQIQQLEAKQIEREAQYAVTQTQLASAQTQVALLEAHVASADANAAQLTAVQQTLSHKTAELIDLTTEKAMLQAQLTQQQQDNTALASTLDELRLTVQQQQQQQQQEQQQQQQQQTEAPTVAKADPAVVRQAVAQLMTISRVSSVHQLASASSSSRAMKAQIRAASIENMSGKLSERDAARDRQQQQEEARRRSSQPANVTVHDAGKDKQDMKHGLALINSLPSILRGVQSFFKIEFEDVQSHFRQMHHELEREVGRWTAFERMARDEPQLDPTSAALVAQLSETLMARLASLQRLVADATHDVDVGVSDAEAQFSLLEKFNDAVTSEYQQVYTQHEKAKAQLQTLNQTLTKKTSTYEALRERHDGLLNQVRQTEDQLQARVRDIADLETSKTILQRTLSDVQARLRVSEDSAHADHERASAAEDAKEALLDRCLQLEKELAAAQGEATQLATAVAEANTQYMTLLASHTSTQEALASATTTHRDHVAQYTLLTQTAAAERKHAREAKAKLSQRIVQLQTSLDEQARAQTMLQREQSDQMQARLAAMQDGTQQEIALLKRHHQMVVEQLERDLEDSQKRTAHETALAQQEHVHLRQQIAQFEDALVTLERQMKQDQVIRDELERQLADAHHDLSGLQAEYASAVASHAQLESARAAADAQYQQSQTLVEQQAREIAKLQTQYEDLDAQLAQATDASRWTAHVEALDTARAQNVALQRHVHQLVQRLQQQQQASQSAQDAQLAEMVAQLDAQTRERERIERDRLQSLAAFKSAYDAQLRALQQDAPVTDTDRLTMHNAVKSLAKTNRQLSQQVAHLEVNHVVAPTPRARIAVAAERPGARQSGPTPQVRVIRVTSPSRKTSL
ncbi:hypothetical protein CXG81DRAFT_18400 [Caulochytrium protostelioides]|uniref:Uncharacterized protein n=1 Tax=Caulochytrium protostelioides TaxID=1555241 RepID=A0A4P9X976_9FUNG|nr:hypothetical protein CXG81DRAFT_18400 [Caulochytrium protostelioides]|eukprot:RKP01832.1 hypothetical protein CXG81DRAFT_18400 [Caulochytrium protostelioides]